MRWVTDSEISALDVTLSEAEDAAWSNLAAAARGVTLHAQVVDGVLLAYLETDFASKASLLLSPALRDRVAESIGWPIHAVLPDRDFVYVWSAQHPEFASRVGAVVVREFKSASYPLCTEVLEVDEEVHALGAFPPD